MKKYLQLAVIGTSLLFLAGCVSKFYQVAPEIYREKVKVLGVLPIYVDAGSTILHPQRQEIVEILQQSSQGKYLKLSEQLNLSAGYQAVRPVIIDLQSQEKLFTGNILKTGKAGTFRSYQFDSAAVTELARSSGVDGILVVVLNGVENKQKRWERVGPRYLEANFNEIQATTVVLGATGELLWERSGVSGPPFVDLQYADFDEAYYNRTDQVSQRFITSEGLSRALQAKDKGLLDKDSFPTLYRQLFDTLSESLAVGKLWRK